MPIPFYLNAAINNIENSEAGTANFFDRNMRRIESTQPIASKERSSWRDNINYDNGYDEEIEDRFRMEHDYSGLADYLSHFRMDNMIDQRAYDNEISRLRTYGRQYDAMHQAASPTQSNAISFLEAFNYDGNISGLDNENVYKKRYSESITELGKSRIIMNPIGGYYDENTIPEREEAATITVSFNNKHVSYGLWGLGPDWMAKDKDEDQFGAFCQQMGYDVGTIRKIIGDNNLTKKEGITSISIPKSNLEAIKLLTDIRGWCNDTGRTTDDIQYRSYGTDNNLISDDTVNIGTQIQAIANTLRDANKDKDDVMGAIGAGEQIYSTTVLGYMNERQMNLRGMASRGLLDDSKFNAAMKADNEVYETLLMSTAFSQLDIYSDVGNQAGDETLNRMTDNIERGKLKDYIRNAIKENRVNWSAAISGGEYGTYISIAPVDDKGDLELKDDDARRGMTIFIPGLFTESVQNAFEASTEGKTVKEMNSMQQYGYDYTLDDGSVLKNLDNNGAELYDKNTNTTQKITRERAQDLLHQSIIVEDGVRAIKNRMFNLDGSLREGYDSKAAAKIIAVQAANDIYPGDTIEEDDVWFTSKEEQAKRNAAGNVNKDYKSQQAFNIYNQIMANIFNLLNNNK